MTDRTASRTEVQPSMGMKEVVLRTGTTLDSGTTDTLTMTLADFGMEKVMMVYGNVHTTDYDVMIECDGSTAVASGVLTITKETGNQNKRQIYVVTGK